MCGNEEIAGDGREKLKMLPMPRWGVVNWTFTARGAVAGSSPVARSISQTHLK